MIGPLQSGVTSGGLMKFGSTVTTRRSLLRSGALAGGLIAAGGVVGGCGVLGIGGTLQRIRDDGRVRLGVAGERPYGYLEAGELVGATVAVHRAIFERLGVRGVDGVVTGFNELIEGLNAGNFDAVAAGMFVTASRCERAAYSEPVYCAPSALLVARGNPHGLSDYASVARANVPLVVLAGGVEEGYAQAAGVPEERLVLVGSQDQGLDLVASGEAAAFALTSVSHRAMLAREQGGGPGPAPDDPTARVQLLAPFVPVVNGHRQLGCGAAAFRRTDGDLVEAFNRELAAMRRDGTVLQLMKPYGFTQAEMPDPGVRTEDLCRTGGARGGELEPLPR